MDGIKVCAFFLIAVIQGRIAYIANPQESLPSLQNIAFDSEVAIADVATGYNESLQSARYSFSFLTDCVSLNAFLDTIPPHILIIFGRCLETFTVLVTRVSAKV